jgi:hypothetical protein
LASKPLDPAGWASSGTDTEDGRICFICGLMASLRKARAKPNPGKPGVSMSAFQRVMTHCAVDRQMVDHVHGKSVPDAGGAGRP